MCCLRGDSVRAEDLGTGALPNGIRRGRPSLPTGFLKSRGLPTGFLGFRGLRRSLLPGLWYTRLERRYCDNPPTHEHRSHLTPSSLQLRVALAERTLGSPHREWCAQSMSAVPKKNILHYELGFCIKYLGKFRIIPDRYLVDLQPENPTESPSAAHRMVAYFRAQGTLELGYK